MVGECLGRLGSRGRAGEGLAWETGGRSAACAAGAALKWTGSGCRDSAMVGREGWKRWRRWDWPMVGSIGGMKTSLAAKEDEQGMGSNLCVGNLCSCSISLFLPKLEGHNRVLLLLLSLLVSITRGAAARASGGGTTVGTGVSSSVTGTDCPPGRQASLKTFCAQSRISSSMVASCSTWS